jgi:hypothetical protein
MISFPVNSCPLCNQVLQLRKVSGVTVYSCPATFEFNSVTGVKPRSHYEVECDKDQCIQHVYVDDWCIDTFDKGAKSRLHKLRTQEDGPSRWKFVVEVPRIVATQEDQLRARLQTLVTFL